MQKNTAKIIKILRLFCSCYWNNIWIGIVLILRNRTLNEWSGPTALYRELLTVFFILFQTTIAKGWWTWTLRWRHITKCELSLEKSWSSRPDPSQSLPTCPRKSRVIYQYRYLSCTEFSYLSIWLWKSFRVYFSCRFSFFKDGPTAVQRKVDRRAEHWAGLCDQLHHGPGAVVGAGCVGGRGLLGPGAGGRRAGRRGRCGGPFPAGHAHRGAGLLPHCGLHGEGRQKDGQIINSFQGDILLRNINSVNLYMLFIEIIRYRYRFNLVHIAFCLKALGLGLFREPGNDGLGAQGHGDVEGKYQILYW